MRISRLLVCLASATAVLLFGSTTSLAAANGYHIEFSFNCNNPSVCFNPQLAGSLGGDWGSINLNADGTGTAQFTSAVHSTPGVPNGAQHLELVLRWTSTTSATGTIFPDPKGSYLDIAVVNISLNPLVIPATPGRYSFNGAQLGAPGVVYMVNILLT